MLTPETLYDRVIVELENNQPTTVRIEAREAVKDEAGAVAFERPLPTILDDLTGVHATAALGPLAGGLAVELEKAKAAVKAHEATIKDQAALLAERAPVQAEIDAAHANVQRLMALVVALGGDPTAESTEQALKQGSIAASSGSTSPTDNQGGDPVSTGDTPVPQVAPPTDEELFNVAAAAPPPEPPPATVPKARPSRRRSSPAE